MDTLIPSLPEFKGQDLKKRLLECLDQEAREFSEVARDYFSKGQLSKEDKVGLLQAVINAVDHVMTGGDWNSSLFLRNTLKPLLAIKIEAETELNNLSEKAGQKTIEIQALSEDEVEVYIALFQSDGHNISKWAMQLRSLDRYVIGRPVYQNAEDVEKRIRLRAAGSNEAYVSVAIKKMDILPQDPLAAPLKDSFESVLLSLKEVAVRNGRILMFVHDRTRYHFVDGQLIKQG